MSNCLSIACCSPMRFGGGLTRAQTVSIALCRVRNVSNEPQVFLTIMDGEEVMRTLLLGPTLVALLVFSAVSPANAWDRGQTQTFAVLPNLPGNAPVAIEGLTVGPDGTVYTPTFGINAKGAVAGPPHLFSFRPDGSSALQRRRGQPGGKSSAAAEHHAAWARLSGLVKDLADLRSRPGDRLAGRSQDRKGERVHEYRARLGVRPQRADIRQGRQCLRLRLVPRGHLDDRTRLAGRR